MSAKYATGMRWGSLTLVSDMQGANDFKSTGKSVFVCDCGLNHFATLNNVTRGIVKHCAACSSKRKSKLHKKHGNSIGFKDRDPIGYKCYYTWQAMKRRCNNKSDNAYHRYGGRGIKVSPEWLSSYESFLSDMGLPPSLDHQIDRKDNDGNYEKANCHWVSRTENARNKRSNRIIAAFGKTQTLSQWEIETGLKRETIARRLNSGSTPEDALSAELIPIGQGNTRKINTPHGEFNTISECSRSIDVSISTIHGRIKSQSFPDWCYL